MRLGSSVWASRSLRTGRPTSNRFAAVVNLGTVAQVRRPGRGVVRPPENSSTASHVGPEPAGVRSQRDPRLLVGGVAARPFRLVFDTVCEPSQRRPLVHVVIMGCGRVGSSLALALERLDHEVAVIDKDEQAFRRLGTEFRGQQVVGVGFDRDVLGKAGIERASAFAAVSNGDNSNIIAARVARETFGVDHVVARIYDARRAAVYERLGIPTVATVPWTTDRFLRTLLPESGAAAWRDPSGTVAVMQLPLHENWVGHSIRDIQEATDCRVAFLMRFGTGILPTAKTVLQADDVVYVAIISGSIADVTAAAAKAPEENN
ncbi:MAG TPA: TrkA family potassium uptake protein [Pseudonocardiaceae bacterium]|nr:TrkA family potassium uptake protein [Pseudonocardiaceae bacterium]